MTTHKQFKMDPYSRAVVAWLRNSETPVQPDRGLSGPEVHDGLGYVVLRNAGGIIAVYRVMNDGKLKKLKRWPGSIKD